jgi:hypothetical protein
LSKSYYGNPIQLPVALEIFPSFRLSMQFQKSFNFSQTVMALRNGAEEKVFGLEKAKAARVLTGPLRKLKVFLLKSLKFTFLSLAKYLITPLHRKSFLENVLRFSPARDAVLRRNNEQATRMGNYVRKSLLSSLSC